MIAVPVGPHLFVPAGVVASVVRSELERAPWRTWGELWT